MSPRTRPFPTPYLGNEGFYRDSLHRKSYSYFEDLQLLFETFYEILEQKFEGPIWDPIFVAQ